MVTVRGKEWTGANGLLATYAYASHAAVCGGGILSGIQKLSEFRTYLGNRVFSRVCAFRHVDAGLWVSLRNYPDARANFTGSELHSGCFICPTGF